MPRKARIDALGALHHIICRGLVRGITQPAVSRLAQRGEKLAIENDLFLAE
jgi:hypothetical protein